MALPFSLNTSSRGWCNIDARGTVVAGTAQFFSLDHILRISPPKKMLVLHRALVGGQLNKIIFRPLSREYGVVYSLSLKGRSKLVSYFKANAARLNKAVFRSFGPESNNSICSYHFRKEEDACFRSVRFSGSTIMHYER